MAFLPSGKNCPLPFFEKYNWKNNAKTRKKVKI